MLYQTHSSPTLSISVPLSSRQSSPQRVHEMVKVLQSSQEEGDGTQSRSEHEQSGESVEEWENPV